MKTVKIIKKYINPKVFWKMEKEKQVEILKKLFEELCQLYNIRNIKFEFQDDIRAYKITGGGVYSPKEKKITLFKISLMTFLHEFAHIFFPDEKRARLWSHKAFYYSFPKLYIKSLNEGKFFHAFDLEAIQKFEENFK